MPSGEGSARFSPNGKWIVYTSDESGRDEVYIQPFPKGGDKVPVSIGGGKFMAVAVQANSSGYWIKIGGPFPHRAISDHRVQLESLESAE